jgi:CRISPR-associated protein Cmr1
MERETLEVEFITPCFLGGVTGPAGVAGQAEWRAASIRGQLRWWFRAVAGGRWGGDLERVRKEEARLFGSTDRRSMLTVRALSGPPSSRQPLGTARTAKELARLWGDESPDTIQRLKLIHRETKAEINSNPVAYLGFGPISMGNTRSYLLPENPARLDLLWQPAPPDGEAGEVFQDALWAWFNLGGLGSKSRKGFGSLRRKEDSPATREKLADKIKELLGKFRTFDREPEWTHFSAHSRIYLASRTANSWQEAMEWLGAWMIAFRRRYGYPGDTRTIDGVALANRDYEWAAPKGRHLRDAVPDRAGFGLPLPFQRQNAGETVTWDLEDEEEDESGKDTRRASPLILHVSRIGNLYMPVLTYMPARFLPEGGRLRFKKPPAKRFEPDEQQIGIIQAFLSDLEGKKLIEQVTP